MEKIRSGVEQLVRKYQAEARSPRLFGTANFTDRALLGLQKDGIRGMFSAITSQLSETGDGYFLSDAFRASGLLLAGSAYLVGHELTSRGFVPNQIAQSRIVQFSSEKVARGVMLLKQPAPVPNPSPA